MPKPDDLAVALARLGALGRNGDIHIRPVLLRVAVDLFVERTVHAAADLRTFEAMVGPLLDQADGETRRAVAEKLFAHPETPKALLDRLVDDRMLAVAELYRHAPLEETELLTAVERGPVTVAMMIAHRQGLSATLVAALAARPEPLIAQALAANRDAPIDKPLFLALVQRARDDQDLATRLAGRAADPVDVAPLFPVLDRDHRQRVINAVRRLDLGRREWGRSDGATAATLARLDKLVATGEWDGFDHALCEALGLDEAALRPLLHDGSGDILALALAGAGASGELAARAFILGDPLIGRSVTAVRRLTALVDAIAPAAARRLVATMVQGHEPPRAAPARHVPVARRSEPAASEAAPAARREQAETPLRRRV